MYVFRKKKIFWYESPYPHPFPSMLRNHIIYSVMTGTYILSTWYILDLIFKLPEIFVPSFTVQDLMTVISIYRFFRHFRLLLKRHTDRAKVVYTSPSSRLSQFVRGSHKFCHNWFSFFEDDGRFSDPKPPAEEEPD